MGRGIRDDCNPKSTSNKSGAPPAASSSKDELAADPASPSIVEDPGVEPAEELKEDGEMTAGLPAVRMDGNEQAAGGVAMAGATGGLGE